MRRSLADQKGRASHLPIVGGEGAAARQRYADRIEIFRRRHAMNRRLPARRNRRPARDGERQDDAAAAERKEMMRAGVLNTGDGTKARHQLFENVTCCGSVATASPESESSNERVLDVEAGIHGRERGEAANEQTGAGEQRDGERHFRDDERPAHARRRGS